MKRQRKTLVATHDSIFAMRVEMSEEIDKKLGAVLTAKDPKYHELQLRLQPLLAANSTAKSILKDLERLAKYEVDAAREFSFQEGDVLDRKIRQIEKKMPSFLAFCARYGGDVGKRDDVELFVREMSANLDAEMEPIMQVMAAKREAMKLELYAEASGSAP
jgi:hypothetical protein